MEGEKRGDWGVPIWWFPLFQWRMRWSHQLSVTGERRKERRFEKREKYKTAISEEGAGSLQRRVARWPGSTGNAPKVWDQEFKRNSVCSAVVSSNEAQRLRRGQNKAHSWVHWGSGCQPQMNVRTTRELLKKILIPGLLLQRLIQFTCSGAQAWIILKALWCC